MGNWEESVLGTLRGANMASANTISQLEMLGGLQMVSPLSPGMCGSCLWLTISPVTC